MRNKKAIVDEYMGIKASLKELYSTMYNNLKKLLEINRPKFEIVSKAMQNIVLKTGEHLLN